MAWQVGVHLVRAYVANGDMRSAVIRASGAGALQYRYLPAGGPAADRGGGRMATDKIEEQLALLLRALYGEEKNKVPGLVQRVDEIQQTLHIMAAERQQWREETERRLSKLEQVKPVTMSERSVLLSGAMVIATISLLMVLLLMLNGRLG